MVVMRESFTAWSARGRSDPSNHRHFASSSLRILLFVIGTASAVKQEARVIARKEPQRHD
jgi:hypothetical protein